MQFLEDDKFGLLIFHAENLDGVLELDTGETAASAFANLHLLGPSTALLVHTLLHFALSILLLTDMYWA